MAEFEKLHLTPNGIIDEDGKIITDKKMFEAISNPKYNNNTLYTKLGQLYGDVLSNKGLNVYDPLLAKMIYYDKMHMFGTDPLTIGKSYIFFTRPELNFSADNILSSPLLEFYYNTDIGKIIMAMLADPDDFIGVYSSKTVKYSKMLKDLDTLKKAAATLHAIQKENDEKINSLQNSKLSDKGIKIDDASLATAHSESIAEIAKLTEQSSDSENAVDIEATYEKVENQIMTVTQDIISDAQESGVIINAYEYYHGLENKEFESRMDSTAIDDSVQQKTLSIYEDTAEDEEEKLQNLNSRIKKLKEYTDAVNNIIIQNPDLVIDPSLPISMRKTAKDSFVVYNSVKKQYEYANYTTPFIPLLSNACISCSGFKDFNLETFTYDSDYFGNSIQVATGQDDVYGPGEFSVEFEDIYGGPISILFLIWVEYISKVSRGYLTASRRNILNLVLDYTSSVYLFVTGRDFSTIMYFARVIGAFPISFPLGQFIQFTREPTLENAKNLSITFKYNSFSPMDIQDLADFNYLSMQEFARKPKLNYELAFGSNDFFTQADPVETSGMAGRGRNAYSMTAREGTYMSWDTSPTSNPGISGMVPYPVVPGSYTDSGFRTSELPNDYWGGYPFIKDLNKLIWVSPRTNPDDRKYTNLYY